MNHLKRVLVSVVCVLLSACSGLLFYPSSDTYSTPQQLQLPIKDRYLKTPDGERLHLWQISATIPRRGVIFYLHGNAENLTSHVGNVMWLPSEGYDVVLLDYRGYGESTGNPDIPGALMDIDTAFFWLTRQDDYQDTPIYLLGQSLGGALALSYLSDYPKARTQLQGVAIVAGFASYRELAREKLSDAWLTWPLQYPLSWLMPDQFDSLAHIADIAPTPLLVMHSENDQIVPFRYGQAIYEQAAEPRYLVTSDTLHNDMFRSPDNRRALLDFLTRSQPTKESL